MVKKIKNFILNLLVLVVTLILVMIFLEGASRILFGKPQSIFIENPDQDLKKTKSPLSIHTPNGIRLRKNAKVNVKNSPLSKKDFEIITNSFGHRHNELGEKNENEIRILVLGDSITLAVYLPYQETYPYNIEAYLRESTKELNFNVINAGVYSIGIREEVQILKDSEAQIKPDTVIVGLYLNDDYESYRYYPIVTKIPPLFHKSYLLMHIVNRIDRLMVKRGYEKYKYNKWKLKDNKRAREQKKFIVMNPVSEGNWSNEKEGFNKLIYESFGDWGYAWSQDFWQKIETYILEMKNESQKHNFEIIFVLFPVRYQVLSNILCDEPQQMFKETMRKLKIKHFDLLPSLREKYKRDKIDLFYDHCHYNPFGTKYIGREIGRFLLENIEINKPNPN